MVKRVILLAGAVLALGGCSGDTAPSDDESGAIRGFEEFSRTVSRPAEFEEASTAFDSADVPMFLARLPPLIESGFGTVEIDQIIDVVETLEIDHARTLEFPITFNGAQTLLVVDVFLDDVDSPDLAFFSVPDLAARINEEMVDFYEESY